MGNALNQLYGCCSAETVNSDYQIDNLTASEAPVNKDNPYSARNENSSALKDPSK